jgi:hypothetical protein
MEDMYITNSVSQRTCTWCGDFIKDNIGVLDEFHSRFCTEECLNDMAEFELNGGEVG